MADLPIIYYPKENLISIVTFRIHENDDNDRMNSHFWITVKKDQTTTAQFETVMHFSQELFNNPDFKDGLKLYFAAYSTNEPHKLIAFQGRLILLDKNTKKANAIAQFSEINVSGEYTSLDLFLSYSSKNINDPGFSQELKDNIFFNTTIPVHIKESKK